MASGEMKRYQWLPGVDSIYAGTAEREEVTQRQCRYCGRWFSSRGITGHERGCDFKEMDRWEIDEDGYIRTDINLGGVFLEVD